MPAETRLFLWMLASAAFFGALASLFGALAAWFKARDGQGGGTALGHGVADAFDRVGESPMPPLARALLVGGIDGLAFGAVVGLGIGLACAWDGQGEWQRLRPLFAGGLALGLGGLAFGLAGRALAGAGAGVLLGLFLGVMAGAAPGYLLAGTDGLMVGILSGAVAGSGAGCWLSAASERR